MIDIPIIFNESFSERYATSLAPKEKIAPKNIAKKFLRDNKAILPAVSELIAERHFTRLSQKNFSIATHFYPLGSCTMKYNPRIMHQLASLPGFLNCHPLAPPEDSQGILECLYELQNYLAEITGMPGIALSPMAGAQGEFAGVAMMRAYHEAKGDTERTEIIIPDAAHGTNPASASMCNFTVREIPTKADGDVDIEALKAAVGPKTAGIMLTNPSTLGVFERSIIEIAKIIHDAGGLLYYDGANLNAILGKVRPGDMGFDVMHMNLHKTFATPHGGGGPGSGPIAVGNRLLPYMPVPIVAQENGKYFWLTEKECPATIGYLSAFGGNIGVALRAYIYIRLLGREGLKKVSEIATLNANYLMKCLQDRGFTAPYPNRKASHEFIISLKNEAKEYGISAKDFGKRLLDYGFHAPTTYFPVLVPECLLIEPTETESKQTIDNFAVAMAAILNEAKTNAEIVKTAPHTMPVKRLDDVKAIKDMDFVWRNKI